MTKYDINLVSVHGSFDFNYQAVWNRASLQNHSVRTTIEWLLHFQALALLNLYEKEFTNMIRIHLPPSQFHHHIKLQKN